MNDEITVGNVLRLAMRVTEQDKELSRLRDLVREMREAVRQFASHGHGPLDNDEFYCPTCGAHHANFSLIPHTSRCWLAKLIAKADAALKESGEPVKYGCHADANSIVSGVFDGVFLDCLEEDCSQVKDGKCGGSHDCQYWRPIK